MANEVVEKKQSWTDLLTQEFERVEEWLPEDIRQEKGTLVFDFITLLKEHPEYKNYKAEELKLGFMKGAVLGLSFYKRECYLIPYGSKLNFQTDYKGELKLARRYGGVVDAYAKIVREGEEYDSGVGEDNRQYVIHKANSFSNAKVVGAYAVLRFADGHIILEEMSKEELENVREQFSKSKSSPAWVKTPTEMYKKVVLRRAMKLLSFEKFVPQQVKAWDEGSDMNFKQVRASEDKVDVIDVSSQAVDENEVKNEVVEEIKNEEGKNE